MAHRVDSLRELRMFAAPLVRSTAMECLRGRLRRCAEQGIYEGTLNVQQCSVYVFTEVGGMGGASRTPTHHCDESGPARFVMSEYVHGSAESKLVSRTTSRPTARCSLKRSQGGTKAVSKRTGAGADARLNAAEKDEGTESHQPTRRCAFANVQARSSHPAVGGMSRLDLLAPQSAPVTNVGPGLSVRAEGNAGDAKRPKDDVRGWSCSRATMQSTTRLAIVSDGRWLVYSPGRSASTRPKSSNGR